MGPMGVLVTRSVAAELRRTNLVSDTCGGGSGSWVQGATRTGHVKDTPRAAVFTGGTSHGRDGRSQGTGRPSSEPAPPAPHRRSEEGSLFDPFTENCSFNVPRQTVVASAGTCHRETGRNQPNRQGEAAGGGRPLAVTLSRTVCRPGRGRGSASCPLLPAA